MAPTSRTTRTTTVVRRFTWRAVHTHTRTTPMSTDLITSPLKETNSSMAVKSVIFGQVALDMLTILSSGTTGSTVPLLKKVSRCTTVKTSVPQSKATTSTDRKLRFS